jgi:hypothetical protein
VVSELPPPRLNSTAKSFDDIVDRCCYAWNTLIDQPWKIMSVSLGYQRSDNGTPSASEFSRTDIQERRQYV